MERSGVGDALMRTMLVIEDLVLAQCVKHMPLIPNQHAVEQLTAAGPHPPLDDRVGQRSQLHRMRMIGTDVSG